MTIPKTKDWKSLPKPMNCFTVRSASMINLNTRKIVRNYAANTKIVVVQKCILPEGTYYRTSEAEHHYLNYAFEASAFGLPNEKAPSAPDTTKNLRKLPSKRKPLSRNKTEAKQKKVQKLEVASPKDGGAKQPQSWWKKVFGRKNG